MSAARAVRLSRGLLLWAALALAGCETQRAGTAQPAMLAPGELLAQAEAPGAPAARPVAPPAREDYGVLLRRSYQFYAEGDYEQALYGYERVLARADDADHQIRALISIAMIRLLPSSKMRDLDAATIVLDELERRLELYGLRFQYFGEMELLQSIAAREGELRALRASNAKLRKEIEARDALISQLRALTVEPTE